MGDIPNFEPSPTYVPEWMLDEEAAIEPNAEWCVHRGPDVDVGGKPSLPAPSSSTRRLTALTSDRWPTLGESAYHGPVGRYAMDAAPHTEADPVAILAQLLTGVGALANRGPYVEAGNDHHPAALFTVIVGDTSRAKKGTAWSGARLVLKSIDAPWCENRILGGFGSGQSLIDELAQPQADEGAEQVGRDTRALLFDAEFAAVLRTGNWESSTLGQTIRKAWDGTKLENRTRGKGTSVATNYHIGAVGHITIEELRSSLKEADTFGGTTNRFLWIAARRSRRLPEGGNIPDSLAAAAALELSKNIARARTHGRYERTPAARDLWADIYNELGDDDPGGLLGAATARSEAQCLRLSLTYAVADGAPAIDVVHLAAAKAVIDYSRATAEMLFPASTALADRLHRGIDDAGAEGISKTAVHGLMNNNATKADIDRAISELIDHGLVVETKVSNSSGKGRPAVVYRAARHINGAAS